MPRGDALESERTFEWPGAASTAPAMADTVEGADMPEGTCQVDDCDRPYYGRGWCKYHYMVKYKAGRLTPRPKPSPLERFWAKVDKTSGCWNWTGYVDKAGYGRFRFDGATRLSHRVAYQLIIGQVPDGLQLDHLCRNRRCCNPTHLEPVTNHENSLRGERATKSHCVHGHEYTPENTIREANGRRRCRTCYLDYQRRLRLRKKQKA